MLRIQLKKLRELKGISQQEFASAIGVAPSAVGNWESGTREPRSLELLEKIADYFCVSTDYLLGRTGQPDQQVKPTPENGDGMSEEMKEIVRLYDQASPQMQAAALAVLRAAEADRKAQGDGEEGQ